MLSSPPSSRRVLIFFIAVFSCAFPVRAAQPESSAEHPYNLVIFVVNCLNKSHVSLYGYSKKTTPNLDRFARDAYVFNNLVSPATWTPPVLQELVSGKVLPTRFFLMDDWRRGMTTLDDYPLAPDLMHQGYAYFYNRLPENGTLPFVSFFHWDKTHTPYDCRLKHRERLPKKEQAIYDRILDEADSIQLVTSFTDTIWPIIRTAIAFDPLRTMLPAQDEVLWRGLLADLKKSDGSAAAFVASRLPPPLLQRLSQVQKAEQLSLQDKSAIVDALNHIIRDPHSPLQDILFGRNIPGGTYTGTNAIGYYPENPDLFSTTSDGRLVLRDRLNKTQNFRLRQIYRELLNGIFPSLTMFIDPKILECPLFNEKKIQDVWVSSPDREAELSLLKDLYDLQLEEADATFGACLRRLKEEGVLDKTIVVFMGDHGDALMEHGLLWHGFAHCYDEVINPPLVIRVPGALSTPMKIDTQLRTADVLPTLMGLMGFPPPKTSDPLDGRNLAPSLGKGDPGVTVFSRDIIRFRSIRRNDGWKLITMGVSGWRELYNVKKDPKELHNVAADFPDIVASLEEEMNRFLYGN